LRAYQSAASNASGEMLEAVKGNASFRAMPDALLSDFVSRCATWHVPRGQFLAEQGTTPDVWFGVVKGAVALTLESGNGGAATLDLLGPGEWIGPEALILGTSLPFAARTFTPSVLMVMRRSTLRELQARHGALSQALLKLSWHRSQRLTERTTMRLHAGIPERLRQMLGALADDFGVQDGPQKRIDLDISQSDLAALVGCSRQGVNKALQSLRQAGEVLFVRNSYYLPNLLCPIG
jgi:CRP/FNR family transcriptional regulator, cyclic AMP receptor protein